MVSSLVLFGTEGVEFDELDDARDTSGFVSVSATPTSARTRLVIVDMVVDMPLRKSDVAVTAVTSGDNRGSVLVG